MGYYDGYLIISDIDGTLTADDGSISEENLQAIRRFQEEGGCFTLATGRGAHFHNGFPIQPNAPTVVINGTMVCALNGETLLALPMEKGCYEEDIRYALDSHPGVTALFRTEYSGNRIWRRDGSGISIDEILNGDAVYRFYFTCDGEPSALRLMDNMTRRCGDRFEFNRSWSDGMEMHIKGSGKGTGLHFLRSYMPQIHTFISAGNYENDISMLREADIGCAVGSSPVNVAEAADRVIVSNNDHAIAYIINELIPSLK